MAIDWAVWGPPLATVVLGGVIARLVLQQVADAEGANAVTREGRANDLASTRDEVVEQLKHLETEREKLAPEEYEAERARLVARGSRALAALDGVDPDQAPRAAAPAASAPAAVAPAPAQPAPIGAEWRGALYALAAVALGWLLWSYLQGNAAPRGQGASMTGNLPGEQQGGMQQDPTQSAEFKSREAELQAKLTADPRDLEALNGLTQLFLSHGAPEKAFEWSKKALDVDPKNADARVYRAVLSAMMGMMDPAVVALDAVLADDPKHQLALVYKGLILLELGRFPEAAAVLEVASAQDPENPMLRERLAQARTGGAPGSPGPAAAGGDLLAAGTLQLDPAAAATLKGTEVLYLSLVDPAKPGPPVAADRINPPIQFPVTFDLTTADIRAMGGGPLPAVFELKARFDGDGNAMTKEPGLPLAVVTGVAKGTAGLQLTMTLDGTPVAAPAGAAPPPAPTAPAGAGDAIASGRVTLGPGVVAGGTETVFVIVKNPAAGPMPIAVKKLPPTFPLDFVLTTADMMAGPGAVPDQITVSVRLDLDGNPTTKDGAKAEVAAPRGATGLALTLQ
jgi:tetratricopeptide (TPR) repeat protein